MAKQKKLYDHIAGKVVPFPAGTIYENTLKYNHIKDGGRYSLPDDVHKYVDLDPVDDTGQEATATSSIEDRIKGARKKDDLIALATEVTGEAADAFDGMTMPEIKQAILDSQA